MSSAPVDSLPAPPVFYLRQAGFDQTAAGLRALACATTFHLRFEDRDYPHRPNSPDWNRNHPTWHLPTADAPPLRFGGVLTPPDGAHAPAVCAFCSRRLHHLLTFRPVPDGLGVTRLDGLSLGVCLSCLGYQDGAGCLFYQHDKAGAVTENIGYDGPRVEAEFLCGPFLPAVVRLAPTPERWRWQDWGMSNGRENLHRVGGHPCWIQDAAYPGCPRCREVMPFLMQLDSNLPAGEPGGGWLWGSGGIAYVHWCDECQVSAIFWQST